MPGAKSKTPDRARPPDPTNRGIYRFWFDVDIRFGDQDSLGHVNNVSFMRYSEDGRIAFSRSLGQKPGNVGGVGWVIAWVAMDYRAELRYPGRVRIGTAVSRLGTSSCTVVQGIFSGRRCAATSEAVLVMFDFAARRTMPIPPWLRRKLTRHLANGPG